MLDSNKYSKIWVLKEDKEFIDSLKIHKKQAAYEVVKQIIDKYKEGKE